MNACRVAIVVLAVGLAGCAQMPAQGSGATGATPSPATEAKPTIDYRDYVQGTATWFDFQNLSDWDSPDATHVVVWSTPTRAWLLTLFGVCSNLAGAPTIALSTHGMVRAGNDAVMVQGERCPIQRIERLDGRRLKAALGR